MPSRSRSRGHVLRALGALGDGLFFSCDGDPDATFDAAVRLLLRLITVGGVLGTDRLLACVESGGPLDALDRACAEIRAAHGEHDLWPLPAGIEDVPEDAVYDAAVHLGAYLRAAGEFSPALSGAYEETLRLCPGRNGGFSLVSDPMRRKAGGAFYTPPAIARQAALHALADAPDDRLPTVLDPAMGTGVFLHEALAVLRARHPEVSAAEIARHCLFGVDCDPAAVSVALLTLAVRSGARVEELASQVRAGNLLEGEMAVAFDAVVGNPPWGARPPGDGDGALLPGMQQGAFDACKPFLALGARCTSGSLAMVVPRALLAQDRHRDIREVLLHALAPRGVTLLEDSAFPDAAAPACILHFTRQPADPVVRCIDLPNERTFDIAACAWTPDAFPIVPANVLALLTRLRLAHPALGDLTAHYKVRDTGINYNRAAVAQEVLYEAGEPDDPRDLPRFRGRDFGRYTPVARGGWLRHDAADRLSPGDRLSYDSELARSHKIVLRQTADTIIATLDDSGMITGRSVLAVMAEDGASLPALLACLNSRLLALLYDALAGEQGRVLPQVKVGRLQALPVPAAVAHAAPRLHDLAVRMLASGGCDSALEEEIDRAVCALYELTPEEVALVRNGPGKGEPVPATPASTAGAELA